MMMSEDVRGRFNNFELATKISLARQLSCLTLTHASIPTPTPVDTLINPLVIFL